MKRQNSLIHQLNKLDAAEGKMPVNYSAGNIPASTSVTKKQPVFQASRDESYVNRSLEYPDYVKEIRSPNVDEFRKIQRTGTNLSFKDYADQKRSIKPKSLAQFTLDKTRGTYDTMKYGDVTVYKSPKARRPRSGETADPLASPLRRYSTAAGSSRPAESAPSYIIYTTGKGSDFSDQAKYQQALLEAEGKTVIMLEVNSYEEFLNAWDSMAEHSDEVLILSHSHNHSIIFPEGDIGGISVNGETLDGSKVIGNIHDLTPKEIDTLTILGCNAGQLDTAETESGNVAQAFADLGSIDEVIAYDGNLSFGLLGAKVEDAIERLIGKDIYDFSREPRMAIDQTSFWSIGKPDLAMWDTEGWRFLPEGQVVYYPDGTYEVKNRW